MQYATHFHVQGWGKRGQFSPTERFSADFDATLWCFMGLQADDFLPAFLTGYEIDFLFFKMDTLCL